LALTSTAIQTNTKGGK